MGPSRRLLGGHLGSSVSALLDGQLDAESTERAWQHVLQCPPCRRLVENEGWVKRQLAQIGDAESADSPPDRLVGSLLDLDPEAVWALPPEPDRSTRGRRRAGIVLVGAGSVSAAVLGLTTLTGSPMGIGSSHNPSSNIGGSTTRPTTTAVTPTAALRSRMPEVAPGRGVGATAHAHRSARAR
jgi:predicted anti-sigma-YlaC factor YlaD